MTACKATRNKDQASGDLQHLHGNGKVGEHLLAECAGDSDRGSRE
jgi:hypothetical protein